MNRPWTLLRFWIFPSKIGALSSLWDITMKWIRRAALLVILLACALGIAVFWTALRSERPVGFQVVQAADPKGQAFAVGVWYPTQARTWPTSWLGLRMMDAARDAPVSGHGLPLVVMRPQVWGVSTRP